MLHNLRQNSRLDAQDSAVGAAEILTTWEALIAQLGECWTLDCKIVGSILNQDAFFLFSFFFFLSILSQSNIDHHLRCGGWLNFEFGLREKHSGWAIKTIYKKLCRGMLKHIPLYQ